jgi:hypothetical protein
MWRTDERYGLFWDLLDARRKPDFSQFITFETQGVKRRWSHSIPDAVRRQYPDFPLPNSDERDQPSMWRRS